MVTNTNCNKILQESFKFSNDSRLIWTENIKSTLSGIGLMESFINKEPLTHLKAFRRLQDIFLQTTLEKIRHENSKLRTYALFKTVPGFEKYQSDFIAELSRLGMKTSTTTAILA